MRRAPFDRESWRPLLAPWCRRCLGADVRTQLFSSGWQSAVLGLELDDGRRVVVKVRPAAVGLRASARVQQALSADGFTCPRVVAGPEPLGPFAVSADELVPVGAPPADLAARVAELAAVLADLVRRSSLLTVAEPFGPPPAWAGWAHAGTAPWPSPGRGEVDLNQGSPTWLSELAAAVARRLRAAPLPLVVGHLDWETPNLAWAGDTITAVFDWDSVTRLNEPAVAGLAASVHPVRDDGPGATIAQTATFLSAYASARGRAWSPAEEQVAWAAGLWVMAYSAVGEAVGGIDGPVTARLRAELAERCDRAGIRGNH